MVGGVSIRNRVVLAPLSGVSDLPFRQIAWRYGAGATVSEMIASRELAQDKRQSRLRILSGEGQPHIVQLAGRDPYWVGEAARIAESEGAEIIDINMGCPAKKVIGGACGSALMREPELALSLVEAAVSAVSVPVSVKMRLGWDENSMNAPQLARNCQDAGAQMITVHGRTRMQFYEGRADWDAIRAVREVLSVPLVANGDVASDRDAREIMQRSGADAVMIGRAAQGQPWIAGVIAGQSAAPNKAEIADIFVEHYRGMLSLYGEAMAIRHARKHLGWYLDKHAPATSPQDRQAILTARDADQVISMMTERLLSNEQTSKCEAA